MVSNDRIPPGLLLLDVDHPPKETSLRLLLWFQDGYIGSVRVDAFIISDRVFNFFVRLVWPFA
jgi:hypothetical protein